MKNLLYLISFCILSFYSYGQEVLVITDLKKISEINDSEDLNSLYVSCLNEQHEACELMMLPEKNSMECSCEESAIEIETKNGKEPQITSEANERLFKKAYEYASKNKFRIYAVNHMTLNSTAYLQLHFTNTNENGRILFATAM